MSRLHLLWHDTEERGESAVVIAVVAGAGVDHVPESCRLKVDLHNQRPLGVVGAAWGRQCLKMISLRRARREEATAKMDKRYIRGPGTHQSGVT
jgi:hypothetical protein